LRFRKLLITNEIEFKENLGLPTEEELAKAGEGISDEIGATKALAAGGHEFAMSGQEIRALENEIKKLKIENSQKDKQNQALKVVNQEIQSQLGAQKIENYSV